MMQHERSSASKVKAHPATAAFAFKSGLEQQLANQVAEAGLPIHYERLRIPYVVPQRSYRPDIILPSGIILEGKGLFMSEDRAKMRLIKQQYPDLDIRFCFYSPGSRIAPKSKTTYSKWAETYGFLWCGRVIPKEWLTEGPNLRSLAAIRSLGFDP